MICYEWIIERIDSYYVYYDSVVPYPMCVFGVPVAIASPKNEKNTAKLFKYNLEHYITFSPLTFVTYLSW